MFSKKGILSLKSELCPQTYIAQANTQITRAKNEGLTEFHVLDIYRENKFRPVKHK